MSTSLSDRDGVACLTLRWQDGPVLARRQLELDSIVAKKPGRVGSAALRQKQARQRLQ